MAKSRTQEYYDSNPEANRRRLKYQKEYDSKPSQRKKRSKLNKDKQEGGL